MATPTTLTEKETYSKDEEARFIRWFLTRAFVFWYRTRFRPTSAYILAKDLETAREKAEKYCENFGLRFISVHPFFLDLDRKPEEPKES